MLNRLDFLSMVLPFCQLVFDLNEFLTTISIILYIILLVVILVMKFKSKNLKSEDIEKFLEYIKEVKDNVKK